MVNVEEQPQEEDELSFRKKLYYIEKLVLAPLSCEQEGQVFSVCPAGAFDQRPTYAGRRRAARHPCSGRSWSPVSRTWQSAGSRNDRGVGDVPTMPLKIEIDGVLYFQKAFLESGAWKAYVRFVDGCLHRTGGRRFR